MPAPKRKPLRRWTTDDVKTLRSSAKAKLSGTATAKILRRTRGAVFQKALALGIRFRSNRRTAR